MIRCPRTPYVFECSSEDQGYRLIGVVAYDGTDWAGWQTQAHGRTIQVSSIILKNVAILLYSMKDVLEARLLQLVRLPIAIAASGRTDAGVHASAQVIISDDNNLF